ncbi:nucleoside 2-deoxyribosyltransferase [Lapidilactobacillus mulanensis]|uniref:Nucleoside 2-deoxyribosyltransferase n=1 Tax=Lapidilactobacillus mulanensis TaxID=2485999 RepID=A0ABW4DNZ2_9LACO|nr:nucleoside 2-deoxyribosyltransferase [Lapidilactobacillus mulanensis]
MVKVYLAGPFFDKFGIEARRVAQVKAILECNETVDAIFSPKDEDVTDPIISQLELMSPEWKEAVFQHDLDGLLTADALVVIADSETNLNGSDDGTAFEVGYWYAMNQFKQQQDPTYKPKPVILLAQSAEKLNLMLAEGSTYFTRELLDLRRLDFNEVPLRKYVGDVN